MNYLSMNQLGALEVSPNVIQFGIFLPGVDPATGYAVSVKIIHETDQYLQAAAPALVAQAHSVDPTYGDYWSGQINLTTAPPPPGIRRGVGPPLYSALIVGCTPPEVAAAFKFAGSRWA